MTYPSDSKEDLRVRRTRKLLQNALIELAALKGFANVTVRDIADLAMVNRATFYRRYQDKYDLLDKYMEEQYEHLEEAGEKARRQGEPERTAEGAPVGLMRLLEHMKTHAAFFRMMLGDKGDPAFARKVRLYIERHFRRMLAEMNGAAQGSGTANPPVDLCLSYISGASLGVISWWLDAGMHYTPGQIAAWSAELSTANLKLASGSSAGQAPPATRR